MKIHFTKMQGLGNDFVVIDAVRQPVDLSPEQIRHIADRRYGVGCDQVLLATPARRSQADFRYLIFNPDGSQAEHCGNGVRCLARFLDDHGLVSAGRHELVIETVNGLSRVRLCDDGPVTVDMGAPVLEPPQIPFRAPARAREYELEVAGQVVRLGAVSMGNPHAVLRVDDVDSAPVETLGPAIEAHHRFPRRVNVGFLQVVTPAHARLRVYERGAGETLACGTGACAAVVSGRLRGWLDEAVDVDLPGGRLVIHWAGEGEHVWMTGPAETVFEGEIRLD